MCLLNLIKFLSNFSLQIQIIPNCVRIIFIITLIKKTRACLLTYHGVNFPCQPTWLSLLTLSFTLSCLGNLVYVISSHRLRGTRNLSPLLLYAFYLRVYVKYDAKSNTGYMVKFLCRYCLCFSRVTRLTETKLGRSMVFLYWF